MWSVLTRLLDGGGRSSRRRRRRHLLQGRRHNVTVSVWPFLNFEPKQHRSLAVAPIYWALRAPGRHIARMGWPGPTWSGSASEPLLRPNCDASRHASLVLILLLARAIAHLGCSWAHARSDTLCSPASRRSAGAGAGAGETNLLFLVCHLTRTRTVHPCQSLYGGIDIDMS